MAAAAASASAVVKNYGYNPEQSFFVSRLLEIEDDVKRYRVQSVASNGKLEYAHKCPRYEGSELNAALWQYAYGLWTAPSSSYTRVIEQAYDMGTTLCDIFARLYAEGRNTVPAKCLFWHTLTDDPTISLRTYCSVDRVEFSFAVSISSGGQFPLRTDSSSNNTAGMHYTAKLFKQAIRLFIVQNRRGVLQDISGVPVLQACGNDGQVRHYFLQVLDECDNKTWLLPCSKGATVTHRHCIPRHYFETVTCQLAEGAQQVVAALEVYAKRHCVLCNHPYLVPRIMWECGVQMAVRSDRGHFVWNNATTDSFLQCAKRVVQCLYDHFATGCGGFDFSGPAGACIVDGSAAYRTAVLALLESITRCSPETMADTLGTVHCADAVRGRQCVPSLPWHGVRYDEVGASCWALPAGMPPPPPPSPSASPHGDLIAYVMSLTGTSSSTVTAADMWQSSSSPSQPPTNLSFMAPIASQAASIRRDIDDYGARVAAMYAALGPHSAVAAAANARAYATESRHTSPHAFSPPPPPSVGGHAAREAAAEAIWERYGLGPLFVAAPPVGPPAPRAVLRTVAPLFSFASAPAAAAAAAAEAAAVVHACEPAPAPPPRLPSSALLPVPVAAVVPSEPKTNPKAPADEDMVAAAAAETIECPVCFGPEPNYVTVPCGHFYCSVCIATLKTCAICQETITMRIKTYLPGGGGGGGK